MLLHHRLHMYTDFITVNLCCCKDFLLFGCFFLCCIIHIFEQSCYVLYCVTHYLHAPGWIYSIWCAVCVAMRTVHALCVHIWEGFLIILWFCITQSANSCCTVTCIHLTADRLRDGWSGLGKICVFLSLCLFPSLFLKAGCTKTCIHISRCI